MFKFFPIYRRELKSYFTSPAVYVSMAMFFFLSGFFFYGILDDFSTLSGNAQYQKEMGYTEVNFTRDVVARLFWSINFILLMVVPIFTMRLLAEEKKSGTFELLKSLPFTDWNIVIAKFLAAYTLLAIMLLVCLYYVGIAVYYGKPEIAVIWVAVVGSFVTAAAYVAIGVFASSVTENQIVAAIIAFAALLMLFLIGDVTTAASTGVSRMLEFLSMRYHSDQFTRGLLRAEDVAYFVVIVLGFLFLTCRSLELRRWKL